MCVFLRSSKLTRTLSMLLFFSANVIVGCTAPQRELVLAVRAAALSVRQSGGSGVRPRRVACWEVIWMVSLLFMVDVVHVCEPSATVLERLSVPVPLISSHLVSCLLSSRKIKRRFGVCFKCTAYALAGLCLGDRCGQPPFWCLSLPCAIPSAVEAPVLSPTLDLSISPFFSSGVVPPRYCCPVPLSLSRFMLAG